MANIPPGTGQPSQPWAMPGPPSAVAPVQGHSPATAVPLVSRLQFAPGLPEFFGRLNGVQWLALVCGVLGALALHLAMAFNWQTQTLTTRLTSSSVGVSSDVPVSFGTLLTTDLEKSPFGSTTGTRTSPRLDYTSYADVLAVLFLLFAVGLVVLVVASSATRGQAQLWIRIAAGVTGLAAVACVALIEIDLAQLATAAEEALRRPLEGRNSEIDVSVESSVGAGVVLAVVGCALLGASAGFSTSGVRHRLSVPVIGASPTGHGSPAGQMEQPTPTEHTVPAGHPMPAEHTVPGGHAMPMGQPMPVGPAAPSGQPTPGPEGVPGTQVWSGPQGPAHDQVWSREHAAADDQVWSGQPVSGQASSGQAALSGGQASAVEQPSGEQASAVQVSGDQGSGEQAPGEQGPPAASGGGVPPAQQPGT